MQILGGVEKNCFASKPATLQIAWILLKVFCDDQELVGLLSSKVDYGATL